MHDAGRPGGALKHRPGALHADLCELFNHDKCIQQRPSATAVLLGQADAEEAELRQLGAVLVGQRLPVTLPFVNVRKVAVPRKACGHLLQLQLLVIEVEAGTLG